MELAELNSHKQRLLQQQDDSRIRIQQLNQQRDQALRNRNAASLLQAFNLSLNEQQSMLSSVCTAMDEIEQKKKVLLSKFTKVYCKQRAYESIHDKQKYQQNRKNELKSQRQLDDMIATRATVATA
jgi:uncharacterized protein (DUF1697 family)